MGHHTHYFGTHSICKVFETYKQHNLLHSLFSVFSINTLHLVNLKTVIILIIQGIITKMKNIHNFHILCTIDHTHTVTVMNYSPAVPGISFIFNLRIDFTSILFLYIIITYILSN